MPANSLPSSRRSIRFIMLAGIALSVLVAVGLYRSATDTPEAQLARARQRTEHPAQTLAVVRALIQSAQGDFPEAEVFECQLLLRMKKTNEAKSRFAAIRHPEACGPESLALLAELAQAHGENALAARALFATGDYVQRNPKRLKLLIYVLYSQQDSDEPEGRILQLCEEYARLVPDDAFPWLISSSLYHERGVPNLAVRAYRETLQRALPVEEVHRVRMQLVQLELLLGELKQAREHCNALLQETRDPAALKMVTAMHAELLQREGQPAEALALLDKLLAETPEWTKARALRGRCRFELQDYAGAVSDLSTAVRQNEFDQQTHYVLAQAYRQLKETARADAHFDRSRELSDIGAQILTLESQLRNDLYNRDLKLRLADLNDKLGDKEKAAAWRRGAQKLRYSEPLPVVP